MIKKLNTLGHRLRPVAGGGDGRVIAPGALILTISWREMAAAISANFAHIKSRFAPPQWRGSSTGQDNHTASCGDHSGGITNPSAAALMDVSSPHSRPVFQSGLRFIHGDRRVLVTASPLVCLTFSL
jgi:hypothetical protein